MEFQNEEEENYIDITEDQDDYSEILQLSSYDGGSVSTNDTWGIVPEFHALDVVETTKKSRILAKDFVKKVSNLLAKTDTEQTPEMGLYLKTVAEINVNKISDLAFLVDSNRQLIENVLLRINSNQGEDFVSFNLYSTLVATHLKLQKELQLSYNDMPAIFKRAKADVMTLEQNVRIDGENDVLVDESSNQFRTQKDLLMSLRQEANNNKMLNT